jgi:septal ring factor EnvC (AmiA/AmiB activator)
MKILIFISLALVGLLLVGLQHQQLRDLRVENSSLRQSSAEASQLKSDLEQSSGDQAQDEAEIARLRQENRDLLKLRNEVFQLRETRVEFQRVSAENQRLQAQARNAPKSERTESLPQPVVINVNALFNSGLNTPEAACQTFFWAAHEHNTEALARCIVPESRLRMGAYAEGNAFKDVISMEIVARRELNADTVQLGITIRMRDASQSPIRYVMKLSRKDGEWRVDLEHPL